MSLCDGPLPPGSNHSFPEFSRHNLTVASEIGSSAFSLLVCLSFFVVLVLIRFVDCVRQHYSLPSLDRIVSLALMTVLQAATFFYSASYNFNPESADAGVCEAQGVIYQFATSAISVEVFAISFTAYQTIVNGVNFQQFRKTYMPWMFFCVYGASALNTFIPFVVQAPTGVQIFGVMDKTSGYCWMQFKRQCLMIFVYFYYLLQFVSHFVSLCLFIKIGSTACRLHAHLRNEARRSVQLYIFRRLVLLTVAALYFMLSFAYAVMYWYGMNRRDARYGAACRFPVAGHQHVN